MNGVLYVWPESVQRTNGSTTWAMIVPLSLSLSLSLEHRLLLYQASVAEAIRKVQTEHKLSSHAVPISEEQTSSEDRQEEHT